MWKWSVALMMGLAVLGTAAEVPAWRDATPGAKFFGADRYWRLRDTLLWHLHDETGDGFSLNIDVRDMNTYLQGPRAVSLMVTGPDGKILARRILEDDGIVNGDAARHDGMPDTYGDIRYRHWHRHHSPGGYPPGKSRSPYLSHPEEIPARTVALRVPPDGKGVYRLLIIGTWDHWVSVTPDRPLTGAVSPGPAPLYVHGAQLAEAWLCAPRGMRDFALAVTEEVTPANWSATLSTADGRELARTAPKTAFNFAVVRDLPSDVYRLQVSGKEPGACLHVFGAPMLLAPDAETARKLRGGMETDKYGRVTFHAHQRTLWDWAYSLRPDDLAIPGKAANPALAVPEASNKLTLGDVPAVAASQALDPASPDFGKFMPTGNAALDKKFNGWYPGALFLAEVAAFDHPDNPWFGHPGLTRRVMLYYATQCFSRQADWFWFSSFGEGDGISAKFPETFTSLWQLGLRSNWYPLQDASFAAHLKPAREAFSWSLPPAVNAAWTQAVQCWAAGRIIAQQGECSNQWAKGLLHMSNIYSATRDPLVQEALRRQTDYFCAAGALGRVSPDDDNWSPKSKTGFAGRAADAGIVGGGIPVEQFGHDGEYCCQTVSHLSEVYRALPNKKITDWLDTYYQLKTHLTLPKDGDWPPSTFAHTLSPTDMNFRTRYYTHKSDLRGTAERIHYGEIWNNQRCDEKPWPVFEKGDFVRDVDKRYGFIKTPAYYSVLYTGSPAPWFHLWTHAKITPGSIDFVGYDGMNYGGLGCKATKPGAVSAVWVPGCGVVWAAQNHNVMYSHGVWARLKHKICEATEAGVDDNVDFEGYNDSGNRLDAETRVYTRDTDFMYLPLTVKRKIKFTDAEIDLEAELTANGDIDASGLYEAVPVYLQNREVKLYDGNFAPVPFAMPATLTTPHNCSSGEVPENMRGPLPDHPGVRFRAFDIVNKKGAGALVLFDREWRAEVTQPIRYRDVGAAGGGFSLALPTRMKKGETLRWRYRIIPHPNPLTAEQLKAME